MVRVTMQQHITRAYIVPDVCRHIVPLEKMS